MDNISILEKERIEMAINYINHGLRIFQDCDYDVSGFKCDFPKNIKLIDDIDNKEKNQSVTE